MISSENTSGWMTASHSLLYLQHFINQLKPKKSTGKKYEKLRSAH
jgi:hypothetical protein